MQVQKIRGVEQRSTEGALAKVPYNCDTNFGECFNEHASGMHLAITASYIYSIQHCVRYCKFAGA